MTIFCCHVTDSLGTVGHVMTPEHTPYAKEDTEAEFHETNMVKPFPSFFSIFFSIQAFYLNEL